MSSGLLNQCISSSHITYSILFIMETYIVLRVICSKTSYASISLMSLFQVPSPTLRDCFIQYRMTTLNSISSSLFCMLSSILVSRGFEECKTLDRRPSAVCLENDDNMRTPDCHTRIFGDATAKRRERECNKNEP